MKFAVAGGMREGWHPVASARDHLAASVQWAIPIDPDQPDARPVPGLRDAAALRAGEG